MKKVAIKLHDYLLGKCPYKGCKNNSEGTCTSNECNHLSYITKIVAVSLNKDTSVLKNTNIVCNEVCIEDGYCQFCGHKLIQIHEKHSEYATEILYECQNPKC